MNPGTLDAFGQNRPRDLVKKNAYQLMGTSYGFVYRCPEGAIAEIHAIQVANVHATNTANASAQWIDRTTGAIVRIVEGLPIAVGNAVNIVAKTIILESGDELQLKASAVSNLEATVVIYEER